ncbi:hypothetical protein K469DRAFT_550359 [Zopfia rhizophila CBS 207.26]|uniref:Uncharacterized protein n=1 Tax=Zopfia rhizophila CBS 207.26 TaxID=1314779 RepID=A0A6A6ERE6_9PEZI|nr:hypothetical protein K469DRAFT_550359 [Zopfia rhizophila CBS 207.26]
MNYKLESPFARKTRIYQTGYVQFFDADTDQCDGAVFSIIGTGPRMTKERRLKLNRLTHEINYVLAYWIDLFNYRWTVPSTLLNAHTTPAHFVDIDPLYNGHRFCRQGVVEPHLSNRDTWIHHFSPFTGQQTMSIENATAVLERLERYYADDTPPGMAVAIPNWAIKTFHPTSPGMAATAGFMVNSKLNYRDRVQATTGRTIDVMVIGDDILYASQDPSSPIYQGIISPLKHIFWSDIRFYDYPPGPPGQPRPVSLQLNFLGSQSPDPHYVDSEPHECYSGLSIAELHQRFVESEDQELQRKFVIIQAGTIDMLAEVGPEEAALRLADFIYTIFDTDRAAVVVVGQIPMIDVRNRAPDWKPIQRRIIEFNARLSAMVNQLQTQGRRILKVHTTTTPEEHREQDYLLPNKQGYRRMAYDYAEAIVEANSRGWIEGGNEVASRANDNPLPTGPDEVGKVVCSQRKPDSKDVPDAERLKILLTRGFQDLEDFAYNFTCDNSQICQVASLENLFGIASNMW